MKTFVAGMLVLMLAVGAGAQAPESATTFKATTRIVVLDVVVSDRKGKPVTRELGRDDFTVLEDGKPQVIRSFEAPSLHRMPVVAAGSGAASVVVESAADLKKIGEAPVTILVIDELNSKFEDSSYSRQMLVKFLQSQPAVLRQPTALMVAENTAFRQLHDYTQSRDALVEAVKKHVPQFPWRMENSGKMGAGAVERMAQVLASLQQIAQSSAGTPGRKNLIWVGNGFPSANLIGLPQDEGDTIEAAVRRVTSRLLAARITMYTINPTANTTVTVEADDPDDLNQTGAEGGPDPFGEGSVSFSAFAPATGGKAFMGRNDLENVIGEGIAKGQEYYTLSYTPTGGSTDAAKFRKIRIVMKDPSLRAVTREGYYPEAVGDLNPVTDATMGAKQVAANLKLDLSAALTTTISYNGLTVTAERPVAGVCAIHVAEAGIEWGEGAKPSAEETVAAGWYDAKGKLLGHVARELTVARGAPDAGAELQLPVVLPAGVARLRIVVRDARNGRMGTVDLTKF
jgi:VWFA-related protein